MAALYPNLVERFKTEGLCPICLTEMELAPRYSCANGHTVCYRCKPYYYSCSVCQSPLDMEIPPQINTPYPPTTHFMPHPLPPQYHPQYPSAPPMDDFYRHERQAWFPPPPPEDQELRSCSYSHLGCWIKVPEHLQDIHESRCQFRPHLEDEHLPTDLKHNQEELVECTYHSVGCNVRTPLWRISIHENYCIYKEKFETIGHITESFDHVTINDDDYGDPEELVECKYRRYGCMVNMPRRRRFIHQQKCNYNKYHHEEEDTYVPPPSPPQFDPDFDPDEQVPCRWNEYGCRVQPKRCRLLMHEQKCNYRLEECVYKDFGCEEMIQPSRKYAHERNCEFAH